MAQLPQALGIRVYYRCCYFSYRSSNFFLTPVASHLLSVLILFLLIVSLSYSCYCYCCYYCCCCCFCYFCYFCCYCDDNDSDDDSILVLPQLSPQNCDYAARLASSKGTRRSCRPLPVPAVLQSLDFRTFPLGKT